MMILAIITGVIFGLDFVSHHCEAITAPIRLQGPLSANGTGRVEIFYNRTWGTICNDGWDIRDAGVVCRQLGYIDSDMVFYSSQFPSGSGKIWLKNVDCTGEEETITSCSHNGWGVTGSCYHYNDVGVECFKAAVPLRLQGPSSLNGTGRVEVFYNGRWGTICDDKWDMKDARVACRQLGYKDVVRALRDGQVPSGSGKIWLSEMDCTGEEQNITRCSHRSWGFHSCEHREDAGVECSTTDFSHADVPLRLQGPFSENGTGRIEVFYHGYWGTICDYVWSIKDARVACRQLGYQDVLRALRGTQVPSASGQIWLSDIECTGKERNITSCTHRGWGVDFCSHSEDVGVECSTQDFTATPVRLRLQGPSSANGRGRVEILYHGYWGTICDSSWNMKNARVVCRQLGYQDVVRTLRRYEFYSGSGDIWLNHLDCTGEERNITSCHHTLGGEYPFCSHGDDAGVECSTTDFSTTPVRLRLQGPLSVNGSGRVEVLYHGYWGTICGDGWDMKIARVVCRQLGYQDVARVLEANEVPRSSRMTWLSKVACTGEEENITSCTHKPWGWGCRSYPQHAGVECSTTDFTNISVRLRLQGPLSANGTGRVEVLYHGYWGKISGYFWNKRDAKVACRQLGYNPDNAKTLKSNLVPYSSGRTWLRYVECTGDEQNIANCSYLSWELHSDASYLEDGFAGVQCSATDFTSIPLRLRLQGPLSAHGIGRVEVFYYGQWGTICESEYRRSMRQNRWHKKTHAVDASYRVICRQLGYYDAVRALRRDEVPLGSERIWLESVFCTGNEEKIENCYLSSWGDNHCSHENDVGVECTANVTTTASPTDSVNFRTEKSKSGEKSNKPKWPLLMTIPAIIIVIVVCVAIFFHRRRLRIKYIKLDSKTPAILFLPKDEHVIILDKKN
ncbi:deleted in malignant brain tumors 1 protein-like [Dendronephthya gigantea]|uniref:deleted in malignant brain tumors 1 protein-like n=1 Tax=Dendronephthya gigantea TaxID=151771 RepID=UPI00106DA37C|nr:deleted in malignant brain tumors 1 protein-like [Dendronephthya gigantea]